MDPPTSSPGASSNGGATLPAIQPPLASLDPSDFPALGAAVGGGHSLSRTTSATTKVSAAVGSAITPSGSTLLGAPPGLLEKAGEDDFPSLPGAAAAAAAVAASGASNTNSNSIVKDTSGGNVVSQLILSAKEAGNEMKSLEESDMPTTDMERFGMKGLLGVIRMENNDETAVAIGSDLGSLGLEVPTTQPASASSTAQKSVTGPGESSGAANNAAGTPGTSAGNAALTANTLSSGGSVLSTTSPAGVIGSTVSADGSVSKTFSLGWHGPGNVITQNASLDFLHHPLLSTNNLQPPFNIPRCYKIGSVGAQSEKLHNFSEETLFFIFYTMPRDSMQELAAQELQNRNWRYHKQLRLWLTKDPNEEEPRQQPNSTAEQGTYIFFDPYVWEKTKKEYYLDYSMIA